MTTSEGHAAPHQVIGQIGGQHSIIQGFGHPLGLYFQGSDDTGRHRQSQFQGVHGIEKGLLILLQVFVVS
jgi:hypothetical protein